MIVRTYPHPHPVHRHPLYDTIGRLKYPNAPQIRLRLWGIFKVLYHGQEEDFEEDWTEEEEEWPEEEEEWPEEEEEFEEEEEW
ncbi:MAG: hypothetical protein FJZ49_03215 [Candidatus Verstraetearchaeota archaeon]|nr:hypothetical protein [Candidatus Verstraetearchaeota archaeon]